MATPCLKCFHILNYRSNNKNLNNEISKILLFFIILFCVNCDYRRRKQKNYKNYVNEKKFDYYNRKIIIQYYKKPHTNLYCLTFEFLDPNSIL